MAARVRPHINIRVLVADFRMANPLRGLAKGQLERLPRTMKRVVFVRLVFHHVLVRKIALQHQLVTRFTSLIAVEDTASRPQGEPLTVQGSAKNLMVTDEKGGTAHITIADVYQSNGVIQVVDKVLLPN